MKLTERKKKKRFVTIRSKLSLSLVIVSLAAFIFSAGISYQLATDRVMDISMQLSAQAMQSGANDFQEQIVSLQHATTLMMQNDSLHALAKITKPSASDAKRYEKDFGVTAREMTNSVTSAHAFDFVGIYLANGYTYETDTLANPPFEDYQQCVAFYSEKGNFIADDQYQAGRWIPFGKNRNGDDVLTYVRFVYERNSLKKIGMVVFGIYEPKLTRSINTGVTDCFLITPNGALLSGTKSFSAGEIHPEAQTILSTIKRHSNSADGVSYVDSEGRTRIISYSRIWQMDAYLVSPFDYYEDVRDREMTGYVQSMFLFAGIEAAVVIVIGVLLSLSLTKSVRSLVNFTQKIAEEDSTLRYVPSTNDEISYLGTKVNDMLDQLQLANQQHEAEMMANQTMAIQLLQQQINPHLLYNTLDSLLWALQQGRFDDAIPLVTALSEFFKISLSRGSEMISLTDEIRICEYFLDLQRLARQKSYQLKTNIPPELLHLQINKLTLQPLIENAVLHGFAGYRDDGIVEISAEQKDDAVIITVEDNGIGMTDDEVITVNESIRKFPRPEDFPHFGLYNIHRRIAQTYGNAYGITVESNISEYTKIAIKLPYRSP